MTYRKKLIEVALPLEAINAACKADKDRKTGTIRNLHKWFAPMPVPAMRALIFAALVDDPADEEERRRLFTIIEQLVASGVETPDRSVMTAARRAIDDSVGSTRPVILDPFCGGGSTLVEAQRLGLEGVGSDLNPIAVLISKVLTEIPPTVINRQALRPSTDTLSDVAAGLSGFIEDVLSYGEQVYEAALKEIGHYYPRGSNGDVVIAWFWARTVQSPDPRYQGAHTPLVGSWWLSKKKGEFGFVAPRVDEASGKVSFDVVDVGTAPPPSKGRCLFSAAPISFDYIRSEGQAGRLGLTMLAMATHGERGRRHLPPDDLHVDAARAVSPKEPPRLELPEHAIGFRVQGYGLKAWADLFTPRQQAMLETFARLVANVAECVVADGGDKDYATAVAAVLGLCVGKLAQFGSTQCLWKIDSRNGSGKAESTKFGRNDIPMVMDFVETNPFGQSVGDWMQIVRTSVNALRFVDANGPPSRVTQSDARTAGAEVDGQAMVITDPPYFGTIGYANLADFFYVWVRRALRGVFPDLFATFATPKNDELIAEPARHGSLAEAKSYFVRGFTTAFESLVKRSRDDLPMVVIYALKEQEEVGEEGRLSGGWEAMLDAILAAGLSITGTWPVHGTGSTRLRGLGANALATYVALVCRPQSADAKRITRRELISALRDELAPAVRVLQEAAIPAVDLAQAVIGPGMAVFSRYAAVLDSDGSKVRVRDALGIINRTLAEIMDGSDGDLDSETRWAIAWFEQCGYSDGAFGEADALSRAKGTAVDTLVRAGVLEAKGNRVRLLTREELPLTYDPRSDRRLTVWEVTQYLIRALEEGGETAASDLLRPVGGIAESARELAYRLYGICERKKWAKEGASYNALAVAWPEVLRLTAERVEERLF